MNKELNTQIQARLRAELKTNPPLHRKIEVESLLFFLEAEETYQKMAENHQG